MVVGKWKKVLASEKLQRSSQTVSVIGSRAYIYGGELRPREPVDSDVHAIDLTSGKCGMEEEEDIHAYYRMPVLRLSTGIIVTQMALSVMPCRPYQGRPAPVLPLEWALPPPFSTVNFTSSLDAVVSQ